MGKWFNSSVDFERLHHVLRLKCELMDLALQDLRTKQSAVQTFEGKSESVRDVQFCPTNANDFAAAFENGTIQV
jgi:hypothetical protein